MCTVQSNLTNDGTLGRRPLTGPQTLEQPSPERLLQCLGICTHRWCGCRSGGHPLKTCKTSNNSECSQHAEGITYAISRHLYNTGNGKELFPSYSEKTEAWGYLVAGQPSKWRVLPDSKAQ